MQTPVRLPPPPTTNIRKTAQEASNINQKPAIKPKSKEKKITSFQNNTLDGATCIYDVISILYTTGQKRVTSGSIFIACDLFSDLYSDPYIQKQVLFLMYGSQFFLQGNGSQTGRFFGCVRVIFFVTRSVTRLCTGLSRIF